MNLSTNVFNVTARLNTTSHHGPNTAFLGYIHLLVAVVSFISIPLILYVYAKSSQLWTPFSVYVISLTVFDLIKSCTHRFYLISNALQIPWLLGDNYCVFVLFVATLISGSILHTQMLISANRLWAVTFPNHYRIYHSKKVSICSVAAVMVYIAAWALPGFILVDPQSHSKFCMYAFSEMNLLFLMTGVFTHFFPQAFVVCLYPFVFWKVHAVMRRKVEVTKDHRLASTDTKKTLPSANSASADPQPAATETNEPEARAIPEESKGKQRLKKLAANVSSQRHFGVLTAMLVSIIVFYTPVHIAFALAIGGRADFRFVAIGHLLEAVDCTLNPILCFLFAREWREAARRLLKSKT